MKRKQEDHNYPLKKEDRALEFLFSINFCDFSAREVTRVLCT